jgi:tellurite resistance protein TerC
MLVNVLPWVGFLVLVLSLLAVDLGLFHREAHEVRFKEALAWSAVWIGLALVFCAGVFWFKGSQAGVEWLTGYVIEKSLAVDNIVVFLLIFSAFGTPTEYQHRVLFWGILVAIVMRAVLIAFAGLLLETFHWVIYVFGAFLIMTGIGLLRGGHAVPSLEGNVLVQAAKRFFPVTEWYEGQRFFVVRNGVRYMTPLFLVLLLVETADLVFAVDSIPAIFAVTNDPFIVYTSNVMAILGLRSLYFVLAKTLSEGRNYLKPFLGLMLTFVGLKMLLSDIYRIPPLVSLGVIVAILFVGIAVWFGRHRRGRNADQDLPAVARPMSRVGAKMQR